MSLSTLIRQVIGSSFQLEVMLSANCYRDGLLNSGRQWQLHPIDDVLPRKDSQRLLRFVFVMEIIGVLFCCPRQQLHRIHPPEVVVIGFLHPQTVLSRITFFLMYLPAD